MSKAIFANNLRYLRMQNNYTRKQAAAACQVSIPSYSKYEEGACYPPIEKMMAICKVFSYYDIHKMVTVDITNNTASNAVVMEKDAMAAINTIIKFIKQ